MEGSFFDLEILPVRVVATSVAAPPCVLTSREVTLRDGWDITVSIFTMNNKFLVVFTRRVFKDND